MIYCMLCDEGGGAGVILAFITNVSSLNYSGIGQNDNYYLMSVEQSTTAILQNTCLSMKHLLNEFAKSEGPMGILLLTILSGYTCFIFRSVRYRRSIPHLSTALLSVALMSFAPPMFPFKFMRLLLSVGCFAAFSTVFGRILLILERMNITKEERNEVDESLFAEFINIMFLNVRPKLVTNAPSRFPSFMEAVSVVIHIVITDICAYLALDWIPKFVEDERCAAIATSLAVGVGVNVSMSAGYNIFAMFLDWYGTPLPAKLRHCHPFLSTSLREFWGTRWNPIFRYVLQSSFYQPLRSMGVPSIVCTATCFLGSALLHGIPLLHSVRDIGLGLQMALFFGAQVLLLSIESTLLWLLMNGTPVYHRVPWVMSAHSPVTETVLEALVIFSLGCACYYGLLSPNANYTAGLCCIFPAIGAVFYHQFVTIAKSSDEKQDLRNHRTVIKALKGVLSWCWTVIVLCTVLPLFSIPMIKCVDTTMGSVITGPLLRIFTGL